MAIHPQPKRLDALQEQEGVEWAQRRPQVAQTLDARLHDKGKVAEGLVEADAVVALARLQQLRERAGAPRKAPAVDDHTADAGAMPADELGGRVNHNVGAMLDRPAQIRRGE